MGYLQTGVMVAGHLQKSVAGNTNVTLTTGDGGEWANGILELTGALTGSIQVILPLTDGYAPWVYNNTSGAFTLTAIGKSGTGVAVPQGYAQQVRSDGTNFTPLGPPVKPGTGALLLTGPFGSQVTAAQDIATGNTITLPTTGDTKRVTASGGAATGVILTAGAFDGQRLRLLNADAANDITFAAAGTSNVADGTGAVITHLRQMILTWDATAARWFH